MCQELSAARVAFVGLARDFDAEAVAPEDLAQALEHLGAIEKTAAVLASVVAARMATLGKRESARKQAVRSLAKASGTSVKEADRAIAAAEQMKDQPEVEAAARAGGLSRQQAMIVSDAAIANPGATQGLLDKAATCSLSELAGEAAKARAAVTDPEARRQEIRKRRSLRSYTDCSGTWHLHAQGLPEDGATVMSAIEPIADRLFDEARRQSRREPPEAYAIDALVRLPLSRTPQDEDQRRLEPG